MIEQMKPDDKDTLLSCNDSFTDKKPNKFK